MIFHKDNLVPPAVSVDAALIDADCRVMIIVVWQLSPTKQIQTFESFPIDDFSVRAAQNSFQAFARNHPELGAAWREMMAEAEASNVSGCLEQDPLTFDPEDPVDAALLKMQSLEQLNTDHY